MKKIRTIICVGLLVPLVVLAVAMTASTYQNFNNANVQVARYYAQHTEFSDSSKIVTENMQNCISPKESQTNNINLMANKVLDDLSEDNFEKTQVISQYIRFKDSDLQNKLTEYGQLHYYLVNGMWIL